MSHLDKLRDTLESRTGFVSLWRAFLGHQVPGLPSFGRSLGAATLAVFLLASLTGVALSLVYSPSTTSAWGSVAHLETAVPLGHLIRAIHHHATSVLLVLGGLHLLHAFASASYRRPREAAWFLGLLAFLLLPAFAITGNLLPMDEDGVWGALVELEVIAAAPLGGLLKRLLLGGDSLGHLTLTRFTTIHTLILPALFLGLGALHLVASRRRAAPEGKSAFFPRQASRDLVASLLAIALVVTLALLFGARLDAPYDPSADYRAHPEWYFLALNQLNSVGGTLAAIIAPGLAVAFLFAVPFLDRRTAGRPAWTVAIPFALIVIGVGALTTRGLLDHRDEGAEATIADRAATALRAYQESGLDAAGRLPDVAALELYRDKGCASCHDEPAFAAPRLSAWATVERTSAFLENPDADRFYAKSPFVELMTAFDGSAEERTLLSRWLLAQPLAAAERDSAHKLYLSKGCTDCHNDPTTPLRDKAYDFRQDGPDLAGYASAEWTRAVIRDANHPSLFGDAISDKDLPKLMPVYPDLTDDELALLVGWLMRGAHGAL